jgi:hypothetical protein
MTEKKYLSRAAIDTVEDRPTGEVEVPQWGGWVRIQAMSAKQRSMITGTMMAVDGVDVKVRADEIGSVQLRTVAACLIEEDGSPTYQEHEYDSIGEKNAGAIETIYTALQELSGLGKDAIEDAEKNSETTPSEQPPSE